MPSIVLSVVVPVLNESANVGPLYAALQPVLTGAVEDAYEIIFVDDGSTDETAEIVARLHKKDRRVKLVSLLRNFGKEIAPAEGIRWNTGQGAGSRVVRSFRLMPLLFRAKSPRA